MNFARCLTYLLNLCQGIFLLSVVIYICIVVDAIRTNRLTGDPITAGVFNPLDDCLIVLDQPATDLSYEKLECEVVSNYGICCGSKHSDVYHNLNCPLVGNIKSENLVYFSTEEEARILGYHFCKTCIEMF